MAGQITCAGAMNSGRAVLVNPCHVIIYRTPPIDPPLLAECAFVDVTAGRGKPVIECDAHTDHAGVAMNAEAL
ncbi:hypothetical protein [Sphaerisporangium sp. TRM90804]|uniref:hypothetical protein n=1 Tax=Sphaerisporangium sp. TRM90804 TaxID=3031113 RepID=UPI00244BAB9F|nr:hypothetical protein [Sphaerisporangium sp. TRM90804]MDH2423995.1 hypothetical protein [Sphaerisporangium sp. TRM90804]